MKIFYLRKFSSLYKSGFALVATLCLMVLIVIIAFGLLTLSSISLRSSSSDSELSRARCNARFALQIALGELQKNAGPDTRVTANAEVLNKTLDQNFPPVLGVWESWQGANHESSGNFSGRPLSPGNYDYEKKARFLAWLTSNPGTPDTPPSTSKTTDTVALVGPGTVGSGADREKLQVHLTPTFVNNNDVKDGYAWWICGENQKARISEPYEPEQNTPAGWATQMKGHSVADPKPFRMEAIIANPALVDKVITRDQSDLIATASTMKVSREFFHDFSANSSGLLTNTATGGWRKDLSLLTENWSRQPKTGLPFFRVKPGEDLLYNMPIRTGDNLPVRAMIYPWSTYRNIGFNVGAIFEVGAVRSWECLANFATTYKSMKNDGALHDLQYSTTGPYVNTYDYHHKPRILPLLARTQWVFSHWAADPPAGSPTGTLEARLLVTPVFTIWNPYNVELTYTCNPAPNEQQFLTFWLRGTLPNAFRYTVGGTANNKYNSLLRSQNYNSPHLMQSFPDSRLAGAAGWRGTLAYSIRSSFTLKPGQTLLFSPVGNPARPVTDVELRPGYRPTGGHYFTLLDDNGTRIIAPSSATMRADARFDAEMATGGVGIYMDMITKPSWIDQNNNWKARILAHRMNTQRSVASTLYPPLANLSSTSLAEAKLQPQPFLTSICGPRTGSNSHLASKGLIQTSPMGSYSEMAKSIGHPAGLKYPGADHPVNSLSDYSFKALATGDSFTPNSGPNNCSYIVTGFNAAEGLSRCILAELPTRPLQSLTELTNWDARHDNPAPPFSFNIIGNSDASPLFPKHAVWNTATAPVGQLSLQHDDSYCTNHLLFDDWFFSSLAPSAAGLGAPGPLDTLKKTYTDFINGTAPLANRAYKAITPDTSSAADIDTLFSKHIDQVDSWKTIASRLEVEGMFNVNSTSVKAWRALLGHARGQRVPYYDAAATPVLSSTKDYAFTRFSISGDVEASSPTAISGTFPGAAEFSGYRTLDDAFLNLLAEEIVNQVRRRGPFLSLAEFVNRQLSSDETLAIGGAIQVALDSVAKNSSATNIYAGLQSPGTAATATPPSVAIAGYNFPNAAIGYNAYGLPGWTRQADVLRPLAPVLSARDDTFTIRAYGDARDAKGTIKVRATCEAVVRRTRDYVDPVDDADITTLPTSSINQTLGRHFEIISFRWLNANEI